jgi:hypothetical protein
MAKTNGGNGNGNGKKRRAVCPYCRESDEVIPILYGMPTPKAFERVERGEVYIGGCSMSPGQPRYYCKCDNREF